MKPIIKSELPKSSFVFKTTPKEKAEKEEKEKAKLNIPIIKQFNNK